jgi:hypothetical protein
MSETKYYCECEDWRKWREGINAYNHSMQIANTYGVNITMREWEYCPWCGKRLRE